MTAATKMDNDYFYMQSITPYGMSDITKHIIDECDRLEYDGSFMFDEYPDKNRMLAITKRIAKNTSSGKSMENMIFQALQMKCSQKTPPPVLQKLEPQMFLLI